MDLLDGLNRLDDIRYLLEGGIFCKINQTVFRVFNLFVTSKNETTNSPIHKIKVLHKYQRAF